MPRFKVAHIREQGVDLIIVPLESKFGNLTQAEQNATIQDLQAHASAANLAGTVVPVWDAGSGRMGFIAPQQWHPFFNGINLIWVSANLTRELYW
jgi:hypothetical protein